MLGWYNSIGWGLLWGMTVNKADQLAAVHFKYDMLASAQCYFLCVWLVYNNAWHISQLYAWLYYRCQQLKISLIHPVEKTLDHVLEQILLIRLLEGVTATDHPDHQFGFKYKPGTNICICALKEIIKKYTRQNSTVFMCVYIKHSIYHLKHYQITDKSSNQSVKVCLPNPCFFLLPCK